MDIEAFLDKARDSISKFCFEECKAYCCRKGYLVLSEKEVRLIFSFDSEKIILETETLEKVKDGKYSLFLGNSSHTCPCLGDDLKCSIHKSPDRPKACKDFPIFLHEGGIITFSDRCPAVKAGKFYGFSRELMQLGCDVVKDSSDEKNKN